MLVTCKGKVLRTAPVAKASLNRAIKYVAADAKPGDLSMARMKRR